MKKAMINVMREILTVDINILKTVVRMIDRIRFKITGRKPVTKKLVEEGIDYDTYQLRFTEVPTDVIVDRYLR